MKAGCAVLVPSCDAYADVWPLFLYALKTYWDDRPYRLFFGTNECTHVDESVVTLRSSAGLVWSDRVRDYLLQIEDEYVILMLEDFILRRPVKTSAITSAVQFCLEHRLDCLRLVPRPPPAVTKGNGNTFGEVYSGEPYRISTQAAVWRREFLLELLRSGESIWQFEISGTQRAETRPCKIWASRQKLLPYEGVLAHHVIEKGKWIPHERWILAARGYPVGVATRPVMTLFHLLCYQFGETIVRLSRLVGERRAERLRAGLRLLLPRALLAWYLRRRSGKT